jgi:RimJ/RimL family protein N-acetyltransferase
MEDIKIIGDKIRLRPLKKEDLSNRVRWFNDPDINKTLFLEENLQLDKTLEWFDRVKNDDSRMDFAIDSMDGEPIGVAGLANINRTHRTAECYCIIGQRKFWGKGIGTEAHRIMFEWAFDKLGIEKIWADINPENIAILKVVERLGFKSEGLLRKDRIIGGRRVDVLRIGLLREEFKKQK